MPDSVGVEDNSVTSFRIASMGNPPLQDEQKRHHIGAQSVSDMGGWVSAYYLMGATSFTTWALVAITAPAPMVIPDMIVSPWAIHI